MRPVTLSADDLLAALDDVTVLDVRWQLGRDDGAEEFAAGHVPGAAYVDLERDLADTPADPVDERGRHPLPDPERFGEAMRRCGVSRARPVVVMDGGGGMAAARCWWLLRHHGHDDVRLLDGGWTRWVELGLPRRDRPAARRARRLPPWTRPAAGGRARGCCRDRRVRRAARRARAGAVPR